MKTIRERLLAIAKERIIILDGAMGSMIQTCKLSEADFKGEAYADHPAPLSGCNDILCLTRPDVITQIHEGYLKAGADIIETCSFNSTAVSLADYKLAGKAYEISRAAAALARKAADMFSTADKPRFVAGSIGPTAKSAGISNDMMDPAKRAIHWDELEAAYYDNARGLLDGGADLFIVETVFDTLNAKAALFAIDRLLDERGLSLADHPVIVSATVTDSGRMLSGQTVEAFAVSVAHAEPLAVGLNCSFGADKLIESVRALSGAVSCLVSAYPNAGMPNQAGLYDETPESMADKCEAYLKEGIVNIIGGCCGTTPAHIAAIAGRAGKYPPRTIPVKKAVRCLSGLEPLYGEQTNAAGSDEFRTLIEDEDYEEAVEVARGMIDDGAAILDVCIDDAAAMRSFLNLALCFRDIAAVPIMAHSDDFSVIEAALKCLQGKGIANSISLKDGEAEFLRRAKLVRRYGAAVVVTDADSRAADLLAKAGFPPEDIIFGGL